MCVCLQSIRRGPQSRFCPLGPTDSNGRSCGLARLSTVLWRANHSEELAKGISCWGAIVNSAVPNLASTVVALRSILTS